MELISNYNLTLKQLLRKRDYIKGLIDLGYNLKKEYENVKEKTGISYLATKTL